jgi:hypothetical protein
MLVWLVSLQTGHVYTRAFKRLQQLQGSWGWRVLLQLHILMSMHDLQCSVPWFMCGMSH